MCVCVCVCVCVCITIILLYIRNLHNDVRQLFCCCSVTKLCLSLCNSMGCSTPGPSVFHYLPEFAQIHQSRWCYLIISFSSVPSPPALSLSQHQFSSVQFSCSVVSDSLRPHGLLHTRPPCPSPAPRVSSNSCPLSGWCHPTISSSVIPFSSHLQSFPASGSFPVSWFFSSGDQSIGTSASASVHPMDIQDWFPLGWTGWISLQSKGLSGVFSSTTVQKHQFFCTQPSLLHNSSH